MKKIFNLKNLTIALLLASLTLVSSCNNVENDSDTFDETTSNLESSETINGNEIRDIVNTNNYSIYEKTVNIIWFLSPILILMARKIMLVKLYPLSIFQALKN